MTHLAKKLTEYELRLIGGWTKDSDAPSVYVHLSGRDAEAAILRMEGIREEPEEVDEVMKPKQCPRCGYTNPHDAIFCMRCSLILDEKTAIELPFKPEENPEIISRILRSPEIQEILKNTLKEILHEQIFKKEGSGFSSLLSKSQVE